MALVLADLVEETTTTSGTGTLSLGGKTSRGRTFVEGIGSGNDTIYGLKASDGSFEVAYGVVTDGSPDTLTRGTLIASSTGSRLDLPSGTHTVFCTFSAALLERIPSVDAAAALAANPGLGADNAVVDVDQMVALVGAYANCAVVTPASVDGVLTLDFSEKTRLIGVASWTETITSIVTSNLPSGASTYLEFNIIGTQSNPSTPFDVEYTAWTGLSSGAVTWETSYYVYQDSSPTFVTGKSYDGGATWHLFGNPPAAYPFVEIGANTSLVRASHEGRVLRVNGAYSLTVNTSTDFNDGGYVEVIAAGGDVTVVATGVTVNTPGYALIIPRYATGVIFANADGSYTLIVSKSIPLDSVPVTTSRALTSDDFDRELVCTTAVTLTVNASLDLPDKKFIHVKARGGNVTFAASSATINSPNSKLVLTNKGQAVLSYGGAADTVDLVGTLQ